MRYSTYTLASLALFLGGCAISPQEPTQMSEIEVTQSTLPTVVKPVDRIDAVLQCIANEHVLENKLFIVGSFADSTGKINAVAQGATGNFMPQGGSAAFMTDALRKAGAQVVSSYFGQPGKQLRADYAINGIFTSLDFSSPVSADVRVSGIGPAYNKGWAQLTVAVQLDLAATRLNRQMSMIQRPIRYQRIGIGTGKTFGGNLVTGSMDWNNQERLQFEALNGPIALGVADVLMKEFPTTKHCREIVANLTD